MAEEERRHCLLLGIPGAYRVCNLRKCFQQWIDAARFQCFHYQGRRSIQRSGNCCVIAFRALGDLEEFMSVFDHALVDEDRGRDSTQTRSQRDGDQRWQIQPLPEEWSEAVGEMMMSRHPVEREVEGWSAVDAVSKMMKRTKTYQTRRERRMACLHQCSDSDIGSSAVAGELVPPAALPFGNVGTPVPLIVRAVKSCSLPAAILMDLNISLRTEKNRKYAHVGYRYTGEVRCEASTDEICGDQEADKRADGRNYDTVSLERDDDPTGSVSENAPELSPPHCSHEGGQDDDADAEDWERHEALVDSSPHRDRLFEEDLEVVWEKGGSGLVIHTDAYYWDALKGGFDERTADLWDVDVSQEISASSTVAKAIERGDVSATLNVDSNDAEDAEDDSALQRRFLEELNEDRDDSFGGFERHTRAIGSRILRMHGWKQGQGLGKRGVGMKRPLYMSMNVDRQGLGFQKRKRRTICQESPQHIIGSIYDGKDGARAGRDF